jgi:hypothetical protein
MECILKAKYDILVEGFDPDNGVSVEEAHHVMHENWSEFMKAGYPCIHMMSPEDIWENYDEILGYGVKPDLATMFASDEEFFDEAFVKAHWKTLVDRGLDPDVMCDRIYPEYIEYEEELQDLLDKGVSAKKTLSMVAEGVRTNRFDLNRDSNVKALDEALRVLHARCLPKYDVGNWVKEWEKWLFWLDCYVLESESDLYEVLGVGMDSAIAAWIETYGCDYLDYNPEFDTLPKAITANRLVDEIPIKDIANCLDDCVVEFFEAFSEAGGNVDRLRERLAEGGYNELLEELDENFSDDD